MTPEEERILAAVALAIPKCELHLHLDGSLSAGFICRRLLSRSLPLPEGVTEEGHGLREYLHQMKANQVTKNGNRAEKNKNWGVFDFCNQVLQTPEELSDGTYDVMQQMHVENVRLCEIRFCPCLHTLEGLSPSEAVWAVVKGFRRAVAEFSMIGGVIVCGLRSFSAEATLAMAELCGALSEETDGVVLGFDIAGDEGSFAITEHLGSLQRAGERGVGVTCHAGEWPVNERFGTDSLDNLRAVLQPQSQSVSRGDAIVAPSSPLVSRVGHGIQVVLDADLLSRMGEARPGSGDEDGDGRGHENEHEQSVMCLEQVCFECCLTANVGWKVASYGVHPVREMVQAGVRVALCCDNLLLSGSADRAPSPSREIIHFVRDVGMSYDDLATVLSNSARASFVFKTRQWEKSKISAWICDFEHEVRTIIATNTNVVSR